MHSVEHMQAHGTCRCDAKHVSVCEYRCVVFISRLELLCLTQAPTVMDTSQSRVARRRRWVQRQIRNLARRVQRWQEEEVSDLVDEYLRLERIIIADLVVYPSGDGVRHYYDIREAMRDIMMQLMLQIIADTAESSVTESVL